MNNFLPSFVTMYPFNGSPAPSVPSDGGLSGDTIAGIVIGVVAFVAIIHALWVSWVMRENWKMEKMKKMKKMKKMRKMRRMRERKASLSRSLDRSFSLGNSAHQKVRVPIYNDQGARRYPEVPVETLRNPDLGRVEGQWVRKIERRWLEKAANSISMTVDPWELEFGPNPVIFAHLVDCVDLPRSDEAQPAMLQQVTISLGPRDAPD
jgi:hypothetical protein